jgi:hypothetical protein
MLPSVLQAGAHNSTTPDSAKSAAAADNGRGAAALPAAQPGRAGQQEAAPTGKRVYKGLSDELDAQEAAWMQQLEQVGLIDAVWCMLVPNFQEVLCKERTEELERYL